MWGHCSFILGPGVCKVLFVPSKRLFPQSCVKFWLLSCGVNGDLFQEGLCHTQVWCTQSPYPCSSSLLTHTSIGDTQTQFCFSLCGISGSWCTQELFEPPECLWQVWGLILNVIYHLARVSPLPLDMGYLLKVATVLCSCRSSTYCRSDAKAEAPILCPPDVKT